MCGPKWHEVNQIEPEPKAKVTRPSLKSIYECSITMALKHFRASLQTLNSAKPG